MLRKTLQHLTTAANIEKALTEIGLPVTVSKHLQTEIDKTFSDTIWFLVNDTGFLVAVKTRRPHNG